MLIDFKDQMNRQCVLEFPPKRIVSLVPSQSELLWDLGLRKELVGITKFCIHPEEMFQSVERIGGTKQLNIEKIRSLKPCLIIGNKEENDQQQISELEKEFPVWMSDIYCLRDALDMIRGVGEITGKRPEALVLETDIIRNFTETPRHEPETALYLIWNNPIMAAGKNTFISDMMDRAGFINLCEELRYPVLQADEIVKLKPQHLLLSSEPFPFNEAHVKLFSELLPETKVSIVDGEYFSWYGSRLKNTPAYFERLNASRNKL